jgi:hypothetical protein
MDLTNTDLLEYVKNLNKSIAVIGKYLDQSYGFKFLSKNKENTIIKINILELNDMKQQIMETSIIFIDIFPYEGKIEHHTYLTLKKWDYQGTILFYNIQHNKSIQNHFWNKIPDEIKYNYNNNIGIIHFNPEFIDSIMPAKIKGNNWTLLTAYFNLTKCNDASKSIKKRDKQYYLNYASSTLNLPYNMVIYCDIDSYQDLIKIRKPDNNKTIYKIRNFDDFVINGKPFKDIREQIKQNRLSNPYEFDNRNTPSYYLFCVSRYIMMKEIIDENPFYSTHFAWINLCMERMGTKNIEKLPEALSMNRDKFSTCYIDYIPQDFVYKTKQYFKKGLCSMCSGFFTGNKHYMEQFCCRFLEKFVEYLNKGYGHSDETLYPFIYFENPDIFQHYYGDYTEMITNYVHIYDRPESPINHFIKNSYYSGNYEKCFEACSILWDSFTKQKCTLSNELLEKLCFYYMMSNKNIAKL